MHLEISSVSAVGHAVGSTLFVYYVGRTGISIITIRVANVVDGFSKLVEVRAMSRMNLLPKLLKVAGNACQSSLVR